MINEKELRERYLKAGVPEHAVESYINAIREGREVISPEELGDLLDRSVASLEDDSAYGCC